MRRAIVFGAGGFIGSSVVKALVRRNVEVCAVVKPGFWDSAECFRLNGLDIPIVECDLRNVLDLKKAIHWDAVDVFYQLAWEGLNGCGITDYTLQLENVRWAMNSIVVASELGCEKFIGAGSISQDELRSDFGKQCCADRHKFFRCAALMCEHMGQGIAAERGMDFIWPIISNVFGEGELNPRLITTLIRALLKKEPMRLGSGQHPYDFIYLSDAAEAYYLIGEFGKGNRRYNIASGETRLLRDYLLQVRNIVAPNVVLHLGERADNGVELKRDSFDISMLQEDTGFQPKVSFEAGIYKTMRWIVEQEGLKIE